jgi:hypothetical protein
LVNRRQAIEAALSAWREAERRLAAGADGDTDALKAEIERRKHEFHQLSAAHMMERLDALSDAERRRAAARPSTDGFHDAAKDEKRIAAEIWEHARASDEDIPGSENHR